MSRTILHADLNNFYASVECLHHPELRGLPVVVCGDPEKRHGIVLAKNNIAKGCGIKTGMVLWQARQLCRNLVCLPADFSLYVRFAMDARKIYLDYTDQIEPFGIDEAWLDMTGSRSVHGGGAAIADELRRRLREELGITASVGVSFNKVFAKLGSDMKKPDATTIIAADNFKEKVWPLPAEDLLFVGRATAEKLSRFMLRTIGDVANADPAFLHAMFGKCGDILRAFANGDDPSPVAVYGDGLPVKSVGNSTTPPRDLSCLEDIRIVCFMLAESVAERMREQGISCRTVQIYVRDCELGSYEKQGKLPASSCTAAEIAGKAIELFASSYRWEKPVRSVGVKATDLIFDADPQLSLLPADLRRVRTETLERTTDTIRRRFGHFSIQRGLLLTDASLARDNPKDDHTIHPVAFRM